MLRVISVHERKMQERGLNCAGGGKFALLGALLSLGAPLGWLVLEHLGGRPPMQVWAESPQLLLYLFMSTIAVFSATGFILGKQWEKLQAVNQTLRELAIYDGLTKLPNARSFWEDAKREKLRAARRKEGFYILVCDLDHFKNINDRHGHLVGDRVLQSVAEAMQSVSREDEGMYRVGGEEFASLLVDLNAEEARMVGERIRSSVEKLRLPLRELREGEEEGEVLKVTISVGVAGGSQTGSADIREIYERADQALYLAKKRGRNRVEVAGAALAEVG